MGSPSVLAVAIVTSLVGLFACPGSFAAGSPERSGAESRVPKFVCPPTGNPYWSYARYKLQVDSLTDRTGWDNPVTAHSAETAYSEPQASGEPRRSLSPVGREDVQRNAPCASVPARVEEWDLQPSIDDTGRSVTTVESQGEAPSGRPGGHLHLSATPTPTSKPTTRAPSADRRLHQRGVVSHKSRQNSLHQGPRAHDTQQKRSLAPSREERGQLIGTSSGMGMRVGSVLPAVCTYKADSVPLPLPGASGRGFTVIIDPGHGGKDPGAISRDGRLKEKGVTLRIAHHLRRILNVEHPELRVFLTRDSDRTMSLKERAALANSRKADLFISIHCNSDTESSPHGIETYFLNTADSHKAMKAAARENAVPVNMMTDLQPAIVDLRKSSRRSESEQLAKTVHHAVIQRLQPVNAAKEDRGVRSGPFRVLAEVAMPAILVECAFVSNTKDRAKLGRSEYIRLLASGLAQGTAQYLTEHIPCLLVHSMR